MNHKFHSAVETDHILTRSRYTTALDMVAWSPCSINMLDKGRHTENGERTHVAFYDAPVWVSLKPGNSVALIGTVRPMTLDIHLLNAYQRNWPTSRSIANAKRRIDPAFDPGHGKLAQVAAAKASCHRSCNELLIIMTKIINQWRLTFLFQRISITINDTILWHSPPPLRSPFGDDPWPTTQIAHQIN